MSRLRDHVRAHARLVSSVAAGAAVAGLLPSTIGLVTRGLLGWNAAVLLYLGQVGWMMRQADHGQLRRVAAQQAETAGTVLRQSVLSFVFNTAILALTVNIAASMF